MKISLRYKAVLCFIIAIVFFEASYIHVYADEVNASEQRVLNEISGEFEIDGIMYRVNPALITEVRNYLLTDVDLTDDQANKLIAYFYENILIGVSENYLIEIEPKDDTVHNNVEDSSEDNTLGVNGNQESNGQGNNGNQGSTGDENALDTKTLSNDGVPVDGEISSNEVISSVDEIPSSDEIPSGDGTLSGEIDSSNMSSLDNENNSLGEGDLSKGNDSFDNEDAAKEQDNYQNDGIIDDIKNQIDNIDSDNYISSDMAAGKVDNGLHIVYIILIGISIILFTGILVILCKRYISTRNGKKKQMAQKQELHGCYIDMHAHILPNVDDGPKSMDETILMLKLAHKQGIRTIIATPHYHVGRRTTPAKLMEIAGEVQKEAEKIDKDFNILLGNEIFYEDGCLEALKNDRACTMAGSRYVLVEFSLDESYKRIYDGMRDFVMEGYSPIIAHAERYRCLYKKKERVRSLIKLGCYIQVNIDSFQNEFLRFVAPYVRDLIAEGLVHFIATDCHNTDSRIPDMESKLASLYRYIDEGIISKLVVINPSKIIEKKYI